MVARSERCRQREKETAELRQLQHERNQREKEDLETAAKLYPPAKHDREPFDPAEHSFDFSIDDVEAYLAGVRAANLSTQHSNRSEIRPNSALPQPDRAARFTRSYHKARQ